MAWRPAVGCLGLLVMAAGYLLLPRLYGVLSLLLTPGADTILLSDPLTGPFLVVVVLGFSFTLAAAAVVEMRQAPVRSLLLILALVVSTPPAAYYAAYRKFYAVTPKADSVELLYLWPRPDETVRTRNVIAVEVRHQRQSFKTGPARDVYRVVITAPDRVWVSESCENKALANSVRDAILRRQSSSRPDQGP